MEDSLAKKLREDYLAPALAEKWENIHSNILAPRGGNVRTFITRLMELAYGNDLHQYNIKPIEVLSFLVHKHKHEFKKFYPLVKGSETYLKAEGLTEKEYHQIIDTLAEIGEHLYKNHYPHFEELYHKEWKTLFSNPISDKELETLRKKHLAAITKNRGKLPLLLGVGSALTFLGAGSYLLYRKKKSEN